MKREYKPEIDEDKIGMNPFTVGLKIPVSEQISSKYLVKERNVDVGLITVPAEMEFEASPYCKIFVDANRRKRVTDLSARAKDLLIWVVYEVDAGKGWVWINRVRYMEANRVHSVNTYRGALKELIANGFLSGTIFTSTYWINPDILFNGSRIKKFQENLSYKRK